MSNIKTFMEFVFMLLLLLRKQCRGQDLPSIDMVRNTSNSVSHALLDNFTEVSKYHLLIKRYSQNVSGVDFRTVHAEDELAKMAAKITQIFANRTKALDAIVAAAEDQTFTYHYSPDLQLGNVTLFKMADYNSSSPELAYNAHLKREVNLNRSGVHTPLEVYEGWFFAKYKRQLVFLDDVDVLNGLRWSEAVDRTFRSNRERDPAISWQYLGSQLGFLRVYPATWWQPPPQLNVDLYDVRRRPWYIEGAVSPKDVIILMDISGSVHGQTFEIMKISVKTMLNTLGENDYVNIAALNDEVGWVNPCVDTLVPATMVNKRTLVAAIDSLKARGTTNWTLGLDFAYRGFVNFNMSQPKHVGANCHKLIMFFSDGGTEWPGDIIDHYKNNSVTKDVRLFTYALGPHPVPSHVLRRMACQNGGYFSVIVASGAIRTAIQDSYLFVLEKPPARSRPYFRAESSPYLDALTYTQVLGAFVPPAHRHMGSVHFDRRGLGYVTTLSRPVFNRSQASEGQSLLGVAGVDITMDEIHSFSPDHKLGPFGYTFAINRNGIVMFHPRLREPLHYMEDPPDLDLTVLEGNTKAIEDFRQQMIRGNPYSKLMDQTVVLDDGYSVDVQRLSFSCLLIDKTMLSLGLVVPNNHTYMVVPEQSVSDDAVQECEECLLAPSWERCANLTAEGADRWQQLMRQLQTGDHSCDNMSVHHLLWDAKLSAMILTQWRSELPTGVIARFFTTEGGLTRFYPNTSAEQLLGESDPHRSSVYRHASLSDDIVFRPRPEHNAVIAARSMSAVHDGSIHTMLVAGVLYNATHLRRLVQALLPDCSEEAGVRCWLVDSGGAVLHASRADTPLGRHLGLVDPQLMAALVNISVFRQHTTYDYQGVCERKTSDVSAGSPLSDPLSWFNVGLLMDTVAGLLHWFDYLRYLLVSLLVSVQAPLAASLDEFGFEVHAFHHSCTQRLVRTQLNPSLDVPDGTIMCHDRDCSRDFRVATVRGTNLLLVVSSLPCDCPELAAQNLPFVPEEDDGPDRCTGQAPPLFRRKYVRCVATHINEKPACGAASLAGGVLPLVAAAAAQRLLQRPVAW